MGSGFGRHIRPQRDHQDSLGFRHKTGCTRYSLATDAISTDEWLVGLHSRLRPRRAGHCVPFLGTFVRQVLSPHRFRLSGWDGSSVEASWAGNGHGSGGAGAGCIW